MKDAKTKKGQQCQENHKLARNMPKLQQDAGKSAVDDAARQSRYQGVQALRQQLNQRNTKRRGTDRLA